MLASMKISLKILLSMVLIAFLTGIVVSMVTGNATEAVIEQAEERELKAYSKQLNAMLERQASMAVAMATQVAGIPEVQKALAENKRSVLSEMFVPSFPEMKKEHGVRQFQFHLPPATSYLRVHRPEKHGDDLSSFRFSVIDTNENKRKVSGLEIGVAGLGMRGIAPISYQGAHIGSVEFGLSFGQAFFEDFKTETGAEVALVLKRGDTYELFASTFPEGAVDASNSDIQKGINGSAIIAPADVDGTSYARLVSPVLDFSGNAIGVLIVATDRSFFLEQSQAALVNTVLVLITVLLVVFGISYFINRSISKPITSLTETMQVLSDGDLSVDVPAIDRKDEIGAMASAVDYFKAACIEKIQLEDKAEEERIAAEQQKLERQKADELAAKRAAEEKAEQERIAEEKLVQERLQLADDFENRVGAIVGNVNAASRDMSTIAETMSAVAADTSSKASDALNETEVSNASVQSVASASEELFASVQEVSGQLANATKVIADAVSQAKSAEVNMLKLQEAGDRINNVIGLINDIAEQTNLLALNATIEAARAGDAGRGFAVVANEVKTLATQTAKATEEIAMQITDMQSATGEAVGAVKQIGQTITEVNDISTAIAGAAEEQTAATQEISQTTQRTASGTQVVIDNIKGVAILSQQSGTSAKEVFEASSGLVDQSDKLQEEVRTFLNEIRGS